MDSNYGLSEFRFIVQGKTAYIKKIVLKRKFKDLIQNAVGENIYNRLYKYIYSNNTQIGM